MGNANISHLHSILVPKEDNTHPARVITLFTPSRWHVELHVLVPRESREHERKVSDCSHSLFRDFSLLLSDEAASLTGDPHKESWRSRQSDAKEYSTLT